MSKMQTFEVCQRFKGRWAVCGTMTCPGDSASKKEALRTWLWKAGIDYDKKPRRWYARPVATPVAETAGK